MSRVPVKPSVGRADNRAGPALARGALLGFSAEFLLLPTGLVTSAVLGRVLGPGDYGVFALVGSLVGWIAWASTAMLARAAVKLVSEAQDPAGVAASLLRWRLLIGVTAFLLLALSATPAASVLHADGGAPYLRVFALDLLLFNIARAYRETLTGRGLFQEVAVVSAVRWIARMVFICILVLWLRTLMAAVIASLLATVAEIACAHRYQQFRLTLASGITRAQLWSVASPLLVFGVATQLHLRADLFALSAWGADPVTLGAYGAAQNLAVAPGLFALAVAPLVLASMSRLRANGRADEARQIARQSLRAAFALVPFIGLVAGTAPHIVGAIFGPAFGDAGPLLIVLFAASVVLAVSAMGVALVAAGATPTAPFALMGFGLLALTLPAHAAAIPRFGALGAATVTLVSGLGLAVVNTRFAHAVWKVHAIPTLLRGIAVGALLFGATRGLGVSSTPALVLVLSVGVVLAAVGMALLGELNADERATARRYFRARLTPAVPLGTPEAGDV